MWRQLNPFGLKLIPLGLERFLSRHIGVSIPLARWRTFPSTALKIALAFSLNRMLEQLWLLHESFQAKSLQFAHVLKVGRTQLQDAVPMTLGQEFHGYATTVAEDYARLKETIWLLSEINLGATAIGTGITADSKYAATVCEQLNEITGLNLETAPAT